MAKTAGFFRKIKLQHTILLLVLLLAIVAAIVYVSNLSIKPDNEHLDRNAQVVSVILSVASLVIGFNLFKRKMLEARNSTETTPERVRKYGNACLLWWTMIFAPALVALLCFLLTASYAFIALAAMHWLILLVFMPRKANIIVLLKLAPGELI